MRIVLTFRSLHNPSFDVTRRKSFSPILFLGGLLTALRIAQEDRTTNVARFDDLQEKGDKFLDREEGRRFLGLEILLLEGIEIISPDQIHLQFCHVSFLGLRVLKWVFAFARRGARVSGCLLFK